MSKILNKPEFLKKFSVRHFLVDKFNTSSNTTNSQCIQNQLVLPQLDYSYDHLEPVIPKKLLTLHHSAHHKAYIDNANNLLSSSSELTVDTVGLSNFR